MEEDVMYWEKQGETLTYLLQAGPHFFSQVEERSSSLDHPSG